MKLLFYSENCKHSMNLLNLLEEKGDLKEIKLICFEKDQFPPEVTKVPTYVTSELNHPLVGKDIFQFFDVLEFFDKPTNNIKFWKDKVIRRPKIDNFIKGKEHQMKYQMFQDNLNKNTNHQVGNSQEELNQLIKDRRNF